MFSSTNIGTQICLVPDLHHSFIAFPIYSKSERERERERERLCLNSKLWIVNGAKTFEEVGSGSCAVGKVVASDNRGLQFESSHRHALYYTVMKRQKYIKKWLGLTQF